MSIILTYTAFECMERLLFLSFVFSIRVISLFLIAHSVQCSFKNYLSMV